MPIPFPLGPMPEAGVTLLAVRPDERHRLVYTIILDCCQKQAEVSHHNLGQRRNRQVARCQLCARRALQPMLIAKKQQRAAERRAGYKSLVPLSTKHHFIAPPWPVPSGFQPLAAVYPHQR